MLVLCARLYAQYATDLNKWVEMLEVEEFLIYDELSPMPDTVEENTPILKVRNIQLKTFPPLKVILLVLGACRYSRESLPTSFGLRTKIFLKLLESTSSTLPFLI